MDLQTETPLFLVSTVLLEQRDLLLILSSVSSSP